MVGVAASLAVMVVLPGCGLILDFDPWPPEPMDAGAERDGGISRDASLDAWHDAYVGDADLRDGARDDAGMVDAFISDAPTTPADARADAEGDAHITDSGLDAGTPEGCADDSIEQGYPADPDAGLTVMVGCDGAIDQCMAETLCAPGWHLCTPAEYQARGGGDASATATRWLAGCMRLGSCTSTGGSNAICGDCSVEGGAPLAIFGNSCPGVIRLESVDCPVGVIASTMPGRYRLDGYLECMFAEVAVTDMTLGATCCR